MAILISTPQELQAINNNLTASYELVNDIDMTGVTFAVIGDGTTIAKRFKGSFDGMGFKIFGINLNRTLANTGLFGYTENATIKNVGLENMNIVSTANYTGGLVGYLINSAITNCYANGYVKGSYGVGGLVGWYASTTESSITDCYSNSTIVSTGRGGGLIGYATGSGASVQNVYANSTTTGATATTHTVIGELTASVPNGQITNLFYNSETENKSQIGTGLTTSQFADSSNFPTFDITTWGFGEYPYLKVFGIPEIPVVAQDVTVNLSSHLNIIHSSLERSKRKVSIALSYSSIVSSEAIRTLEVMKNVTSHIDEIVSNITTLQNANVKEYQISSYVNGIGSNASRVVRTVRTATSGINPIQIVTDIQIPHDEIKPVFASVCIVENPTSSQAINNYTIASCKLNRIEMTVM